MAWGVWVVSCRHRTLFEFYLTCDGSPASRTSGSSSAVYCQLSPFGSTDEQILVANHTDSVCDASAAKLNGLLPDCSKNGRPQVTCGANNRFGIFYPHQKAVLDAETLTGSSTFATCTVVAAAVNTAIYEYTERQNGVGTGLGTVSTFHCSGTNNGYVAVFAL